MGAAPERTEAGGRGRPQAPTRDVPRGTVRFTPMVRLTKREAFDACQALANADRFLTRAGRKAEASALGDLFELFEERLSAGSQ